jgi:hypothetical protein
VIDGSRQACLLPPFAPAPDETALPDGSTLARVAERTWNVQFAGDRTPSAEESAALLARLRDGGLTFLDYGVYCGTPAHLCFQITGSLCEQHVTDTMSAFRDALAQDATLAGASIELQVVLAGHLGPRCTPDDPACLPLPYQGEPHFAPDGPRHAGVLASHSAGACSHDGECVVGGCGNHCMLWEYGGANESATCEGYASTDSSPMFCGCVDGGCAWFTQ